MNPASKVHPSQVAIVQQSHQQSTNCLYRLFCCCRRIKTAPAAPETQVASNTKNPLTLKEIELVEKGLHAPFSPHSALRRPKALDHVAISIKDPVPSAMGGAAPFVREESRVPSPLLLDVETDAALPGLKHSSHLKVEKVPTAFDFALMFVLNPIKKQLPDVDDVLKVQVIHEIFKINNFSNLLALKEILQTKENEYLIARLDPELQAKLRSLAERPTTFEILRSLKK